MSFFGSKNKQSFTLSISLKSSSIDLQLVSQAPSGKKEVLFVERAIIFLENSQDPALYTSECFKELNTVLDKNHAKLKQLSAGAPLRIQMILYAPWFTSSIVPIVHKEPAVIDESFLSKKLTGLKTDAQLQNLEKRIIKIQTNGYTLTELPQNKCADIYLSVYTSSISKKIHEQFLDVVKKYFPLKSGISYTTSPMLISDNIKRFMVQEDNATFLYIGGEITEVGVIEDDALSHFATFPIGKHDFLREIQTKVKTYDYDVLYQKEIQLKSKKQQEQFDKLKQNWAESVVQSLQLFNKHVPSKLLIVTDTKSKDFFTDILLTAIKQNAESMLKNNRIINFDISLLKDIISYKTPFGDSELDLKLEALM
jgi:hypothetical protein